MSTRWWRCPGDQSGFSRTSALRLPTTQTPLALRAALRGVETLVFVSSDGPTADVVLHHQNVIRAAAASRVGHIVALSALDADPESPFCYAVSYGHTERMLRDSGCPISIARASVFTECPRHEETTMPKYLLHDEYTPQELAGGRS